MNLEIDYTKLRPPAGPLPLIRQISYRVSPLLAGAGLTPNQVSLIGLVAGLNAAALFTHCERLALFAAALAWAVCYLMDYCDGEVARLTGRSSRFGRYLDDFVDWAVHAALFLALGYRAAEQFQDELWWWFGIVAATGSSINSLSSLLRSLARDRKGLPEPHVPGSPELPASPGEKAIYVFRVLFRADFWLLVVVLAFLDLTWLLLPALAIGTHAYWITGLFRGVERFVS